MGPGALGAGGVSNVAHDRIPLVLPVEDIGTDLLGGTTAVVVRVDGRKADWLWLCAGRIIAFAVGWLGDTNRDLVDLVGPIQAHGSVEEMTRVALLFSHISESSLGVDVFLVIFVVTWVGAGLDGNLGAALPGVHLVVPAIVIKLNRPEQGVDTTLVCGVGFTVLVEVLLDAEVAESALVERVLVDSAALVGGTLVVNLVLEAGNGTERSGLAVFGRLLALTINTPDRLLEGILILERPVIIFSNLIHVSVSVVGATLLPFT